MHVVLRNIHPGYFLKLQILIVCKNVVIFGVENSSSVHINNKKSDPTQGLNGNTTTRRTTEAKYYDYFSRSQGKLCLRLNLKGRKSFLFVTSTKIHQFKAKTSKIKP